MDEIKNKPGVHTLIFLGAIACFVFYQFFYPYHFYYQEQNQLFLGTWDYVLSYLDKPGWLACLAGDFLTQFYYYKGVGPAILTLGILLAGYDIRHALEVTGVKGTWVPYTVACLAMILLVFCSFDYHFRLCSVIAFIGGADVFRTSTSSFNRTAKFLKEIDALDQKLNHKNGIGLYHWVLAFNIFITVMVCHWFFGSGVWIYAALVVWGCIVNFKHPGNLLRWAALILPFILMLPCKRLYGLDYEELYTYPKIGKLSLPQMEWERTFDADFEYYRGDYNKIINSAEKAENPNRYMVFFYNLVMAQNHSLTTNLLKFKHPELGSFQMLDKKTPTIVLHALNELSWTLGDMASCKRTAILANIQSPDSRSIRMVKRLAEINLVTGDYDTARKYLRILQKTVVWNNWADRIFAALGQNATREEQSALQPYIAKQPFVNTQDTTRTNDDYRVIMHELAKSNPENYMAINYMLCSDLLQKDLKAFKKDYDTFYLKQKSPLYSKFYQEVLAMYLTQTHATPDEWKYYIKQPLAVENYLHYQQNPDNPAFRYSYWRYYDKGEKPKEDYNENNSEVVE